MTDLNPSPLTPADLDPADFQPADLAALGEGHIAYVRPIRSDEVRRFFPQAPELTPGLDLFALLSASGAPIMLAAAHIPAEPEYLTIDPSGVAPALVNLGCLMFALSGLTLAISAAGRIPLPAARRSPMP